MDWKLIAIDLDGTALQNDKHHISRRLARALEAAHEKGVHVLVSTGRPFGILPPDIRSGADWNDLCVLCNGAEVRNLRTGELLATNCMTGRQLLTAVEKAEQMDVPLEVFQGNHMYLSRRGLEQIDESQLPHLRYHRENTIRFLGRVVEDLREICEPDRADYAKLLFPVIAGETREEMREFLTQIGLVCAADSPYTMEVTAPTATKANGVSWVCRHYGISMEQVMAFGDSDNDLSLLRVAGKGVAVGNAPEDVKAEADEVTASNVEDGVAIIIERDIL